MRPGVLGMCAQPGPRDGTSAELCQPGPGSRLLAVWGPAVLTGLRWPQALPESGSPPPSTCQCRALELRAAGGPSTSPAPQNCSLSVPEVCGVWGPCALWVLVEPAMWGGPMGTRQHGHVQLGWVCALHGVALGGHIRNAWEAGGASRTQWPLESHCGGEEVTAWFSCLPEPPVPEYGLESWVALPAPWPPGLPRPP